MYKITVTSLFFFNLTRLCVRAARASIEILGVFFLKKTLSRHHLSSNVAHTGWLCAEYELDKYVCGRAHGTLFANN